MERGHGEYCLTEVVDLLSKTFAAFFATNRLPFFSLYVFVLNHILDNIRYHWQRDHMDAAYIQVLEQSFTLDRCNDADDRPQWRKQKTSRLLLLPALQTLIGNILWRLKNKFLDSVPLVTEFNIQLWKHTIWGSSIQNNAGTEAFAMKSSSMISAPCHRADSLCLIYITTK